MSTHLFIYLLIDMNYNKNLIGECIVSARNSPWHAALLRIPAAPVFCNSLYNRYEHLTTA